eukprot:COSAG05_NODE_22273_length_266_cov_0.568862_1_plen_29_part_10
MDDAHALLHTSDGTIFDAHSPSLSLSLSL